ncbi:MAG: Resolvase domain protein [Segetibacter sp.]|nr:Resolvase domain protein [Segetibacter sp.]
MKQTDELSIFKQFITHELESVRHDGQSNYGVIYTRVSSKEQFEKNGSIESQTKICKVFAEKTGIQILQSFGGTFESAKTEERKEFQKMMKFVNQVKQKVKFIIVSDNDRFSRTGGNAIYIATELRKRGIQVVAAAAPVDTLNPVGAFQQDIQLLFSHFDNQMRRERTIRGMRQKYEKGLWIGKVPYGYDIIKRNGESSIVINDEGKLLAKAFRWKAEQQMPSAEIAKRLQKLGSRFDEKYLSRLFPNLFYCGLISCKMLGDKIVQGKNWEPIVTKELFLKANQVLLNNRVKYKSRIEDDNIPLRHIIYCDKCSKPMTGYLVKAKQKYYYKCNTKGCCSNKSATEVHKGFEALLQEYQVPEQYFSVLRLHLKASLQILEESFSQNEINYAKRRREIEEKLERVEERFIMGDVPREVYEKYKGKFSIEMQDLIKEMNGSLVKLSNLENLTEKCLQIAGNLSKIWASGGLIEKQRLQKLMFPGKLYYNVQNNTYRTTEVNQVILSMVSPVRDSEGSKIKNPSQFAKGSTSVGPAGFEPTYTEPKSVVLPLDDGPNFPSKGSANIIS